MEGVLGPLDRPIIIDEFTYEQVKGVECLGQVGSISDAKNASLNPLN
jgi:hypothetical protein